MKTQMIDAPPEDELRPEYDETLLKNGVRGKYVERMQAGKNLVLLAPDVAEVFPTAQAVNDALRLLIQLSRITQQAAQTTTQRNAAGQASEVDHALAL